MTLATQVRAELEAERSFLLEELSEWRRRAEADGELRQHHTQIARTTRTLESVLEKALAGTALGPAPALTPPVPAPGDHAPPPPLRLGQAEDLRHALGTVHLLWEFFRDKFAQRDVRFFSDHLGAADDLAWECYEPFLNAAAEAAGAAPDPAAELPTAGPGPTAPAGQDEIRRGLLKEPPLLFYSPDRSPFAQARSSAFRPAGLSSKDVDSFRQALLRLPVPIIGFPWPQARRMPALAFVGHETGHVVAEDLGLGEELPGLVDGLGLPAERAEVWKAWADEAFADVFGMLAVGGAYLTQMIRLLAADEPAVRGERIDPAKPGDYPTRSLRVALCREAAGRLGLAPGLDRPWTDTYGTPAGDSAAYFGDVAGVAEAFLEGPYSSLGTESPGKGSLRAVLPWRAEDDAHADVVAAEALEGADPPVPFSARRWVAGAVLAQGRDADRYARRRLDEALARRIVEARGQGVRSAKTRSVRSRVLRSTTPGPASAAAEDDRTTEALDRAAGADVALLLGL